jgi:peptide/nickel transport system permease protein
LIRRVLQGVVVVFGVTIITFLLPTLFHGNIAKEIIGRNATQSEMAQFNKTFGFNLPLWHQYYLYMDHLIHGNLGISTGKANFGQPVRQLLGSAIWRTVWLALSSLVISLAIAIPLGMSQALRRNTAFDYVATGIVFIIYSTPVFLLSILLIEAFAIHLHWFPPFVTSAQNAGGVFGPLVAMFSDWQQFALPVATLVGLTVGGFSRYMRGSVLDALVQDYVRTARAKGASSTRVLYRHTLRNAIIPIITLLGLSLPGLFGGALITEEVFSYPGLGVFVVNATFTDDINSVMAATLLIAVTTIIGNLLADVALSIIDPRVRLTATR